MSPIPPIPPIPPIGFIALVSYGKSTMAVSVVIIKEEILAASTKAVLTTLVGSMIPSLTISVY